MPVSDTLHLAHLGARRVAFRGAPEACGRILLLGEDNPQSALPEHALYPLPAGCAGNRLQEDILGIARACYLATWRTNLCSPTWKKRDAEARSIHLLEADVPWEVIVLLGRKVADTYAYARDEGIAFFASFQHEVHYMNGPHAGATRTFTLVSLPHPSGRNLVWNDPRRAADARQLMREVAPSVPWGELLGEAE